ncbi:MAG: hypothetical protein R3310_08275 [Candidatus Competibacteraceae bacterium]|nr:hypothetical protein [Candidatus Competibacteraceae bacterium]
MTRISIIGAGAWGTGCAKEQRTVDRTVEQLLQRPSGREFGF